MALPMQLARVGLSIGGALLTLGLALKLLRVSEFTDVVTAVAARLRRPRT